LESWGFGDGDGDHPDTGGALFALADGVRAAIAVERDVLVHSAREDVLFIMALEESEDGVYGVCERGVSRCRRDARALLQVDKDGDHAAVARRRERAGEHDREALAVAPEVMSWWEGGAREGGEGQEREVGERAAGALEGGLELVEVVIVARAGGVERGRLWFCLFARATEAVRGVRYVFERCRRHIRCRRCH